MIIQITNKPINEYQIQDISIDLKLDEISASLPIDECHIVAKIDNETASLFSYNARFEVFDNAEKIGEFYTRECKEIGVNTYEIYAVSVLGVLAERSFPGKYFATASGGYYTFADALTEVIGDDEIELVIEDESEDFDVRGWVGHCSRREALRHLCMTAGVTVYNNKGVLTFRRAFGGYWSGTRNAEHSYQPYEVFNDYIITNGTMYSHFAVEIFTFGDAVTDNYVTDPETKKKYYYTTEKLRQANPNYPEGMPTNELYIQGEMLVSSYSVGFQMISMLEKYYEGGIELNFRVIDSDPMFNGVGFPLNGKMVFGYPSAISISYGRNRAYGRDNSISYNCAMAYYESPRIININYKNSAGDLLLTQPFYKGEEEHFTVSHPLITLKVDNRHKVVYKTPQRVTEHTDDIYADPIDIDIICDVAIIQDGNALEVYAVDEGEGETVDGKYGLTIGGLVNG